MDATLFTTLVLTATVAIAALVYLGIAYSDSEAATKRRMAEDRQRAFIADREAAIRIMAEYRGQK
jgi:hypothetical protein